ncbi:hypothetical protein V2J09_023295, partial [Rumex salicifolius]
ISTATRQKHTFPSSQPKSTIHLDPALFSTSLSFSNTSMATFTCSFSLLQFSSSKSSITHFPPKFATARRFRLPPAACLRSPPPHESLPTKTPFSPSNPKITESSQKDPDYSYALANPNGNNPTSRFAQSAESSIERVIFDFRFLALLAIGGSLAGLIITYWMSVVLMLISLLAITYLQALNFYRINGCVYIVDAYKVYWSSCLKGVHTGQMVLRLVEAIDVYLAGTVMFIFGMGLYGLFISNVSSGLPPADDHALKGSSLFGMFALKERPKWMKISSLDELKTKVGHVIVMILLVKMFERSKMVKITTGLDLLSYSVCIFLSSASLYILHNLNKPESD